MKLQLTLALRYLNGRRLRTFLTTLAIVFGVMVLFGMNGLMPAIANAFRQTLLSAAQQVDLTITSEARGSFSEAAATTLRAAPGVAQATGALIQPVALPETLAPPVAGGQPVTNLILNGLDPESASQVRPLTVLEGRFLTAADDRHILITERLAQRAGLVLGDTLRLPAVSGAVAFEIVGVVAARPGATTEEVYVPLRAAQALLDQPGQINTLEALFAAGSDADATRAAALAALGPGFRAGANEVGGEMLAALQMGELFFTLAGVLSLAMGGFIIFNTFRTVVTERRRDLALLRAVGASRRGILGLILTESLLQGVVGTLGGMVAGYLLISAVVASLQPLAEQQWHIHLSSPTFTAGTYALAIGLGVGVTALGGLLPARAAARLSPLEALRPTLGATSWQATGRRALIGAALIGLALLTLATGQVALLAVGMLSFCIGLMLVAPALIQPIAATFGQLLTLAFAREGRLAQGNLVRQPERAAVTASTMMIGLAILVGLAGMITSSTFGVLKYMDDSLGSDYLVLPQSRVLGGGNVGAGPALAASLRATPGVAAVTTLRLSTTRIGEETLQVIGIEPETYPLLGGLNFSAGDAATAYPALAQGRALISNGIFAAQAGLQTGQEVTLQTPTGPQVYRVVAIGTDYLNAKIATVFISQENLARDFNERNDMLLLANRAPDAEAAAVTAALTAAVADYPAFTLLETAVWKEGLLATTNSRLGIVYVLMAALATPSLIALVNTLGINVLERTREIGMLRAVGATRRQVHRLIVAEGLLLAAAGTGFGLLAGVWLSYLLVGALNVGGFSLPYFFPWAGVALTVGVGLLFGVGGALIPARQAARLDIINALRYE